MSQLVSSVGALQKPEVSHPVGFEIFKNASLIKYWHFFAPFLKADWRWVIASAALVFLSALLAIPAPILSGKLLDQVVTVRNGRAMLELAFFLAAFTILRRILGPLQTFCTTRFEQNIMLRLKNALLNRILGLPKPFFDQHQPGYLMSCFSNDLERLSWFFSGPLAGLFLDGTKIVFAGTAIFWLEKRLSVPALIFVPLTFLVTRYFGHQLYQVSQMQFEQQAQVEKDLQETLSAAVLIKALAVEQNSVERMGGTWKKLQQVFFQQIRLLITANALISFIPDLARAVLLAAGGYLIYSNEMTPGVLLACFALSGQIFQPVMNLANSVFEYQETRTAVERVMAIWNEAPEAAAEDGLVLSALRGKIEFQQVDFAYEAREKILDQLSFVIQPGQRVALVGASGVGKTTLLSLLLGFYQPVQGRVLFDDHELGELNLGRLRRQIGFMAQSTGFISGSLHENLILGAGSDVSTEDLLAATSAVGLQDFVAGLPARLETRLGENGLNLSAGQRQRLALARTLVKHPDLFILDEPTAALDGSNEQNFLSALFAQTAGKTCIIVTHRCEVMEKVDRVLVLDHGQLVADGPHSLLKDTCPLYQKLYLTPKDWAGVGAG